MGSTTYQLVKDFFHQQYLGSSNSWVSHKYSCGEKFPIIEAPTHPIHELSCHVHEKSSPACLLGFLRGWIPTYHFGGGIHFDQPWSKDPPTRISHGFPQAPWLHWIVHDPPNQRPPVAKTPTKTTNGNGLHPWSLTAAPVLHGGFQGRVWDPLSNW